MVVSEIESVTALASAAVAAGFVHTWIGPDHYLPLLGLAKVERWSLRRALAVTALLGVVHCALALIVVFGASSAVGVLGWQVAAATPLAWLCVGLGAAVLVAALRSARARRDEPLAGTSRRWVRGLWFALFVLGPCEWLWPCALPALQGHGVGGLLWVSAAYTLATVFAMTAAVAVGMTAAARWNPRPAAAQAVLGALLMVSGGVVLVGL